MEPAVRRAAAAQGDSARTGSIRAGTRCRDERRQQGAAGAASGLRQKAGVSGVTLV